MPAAKKKPAKQSTFSAVASSTFNHRSTSDEAARILERWQSWDIGYWSGDDLHLEVTTAGEQAIIF